MTDEEKKLVGFAYQMLEARKVITLDDIQEIVTNLLPLKATLFPELDGDWLFNTLRELFVDRIDKPRILEGPDRREPWLSEFKATSGCKWEFWNDYKKYLVQEKGFHKVVVDELDELTDNTLDHLFNPNRTGIHLHKKGMVVGQVQSGKTSNYTGLICKAADAGFDIIIVLAGLLNNLRSQTQLRLDEGFLGQYTQDMKDNGSSLKCGVGKINKFHPVAQSYTTSLEKGDFSKRVAEQLGRNFESKEPILMVVKKNKSVLTNLANWLTVKILPEDVCKTKSLLLIDDEADNASINTSKKITPSAINGCIRQLLSKFAKVGYVGYTATPFANIFIPLNETDLFPRDFIINLPTPSNYIGPNRVFGTTDIIDDKATKVLPIVRMIDDFSEFVPNKHKKDDPLPTESDIPDSLKEAVCCFILSCAVRMARGQVHVHNSMLVHVSRYQIWQEEIKYLVNRLFISLREEVCYHKNGPLDRFRKLYEESTESYTCYSDVTNKVISGEYGATDSQLVALPWKKIKDFLYPAVQKIRVISVNGSSNDVLEYHKNRQYGMSAIVIGGDKLSRGLTLEGLSISYFLRASKMYDTLMQMGRWFGYRPGYADLCRLYLSPELNEWFRHITIASEELRKEFDYLSDIGGTPDQFGLKVRSHPGVLQITAANKMRHVRTVNVSWSGRLVETYALYMDERVKHSNFIAVDKFLSSLPKYKDQINGHHFMWKGIQAERVRNLLGQFKVAESLKSVNLDLIDKYVSRLNAYGELKTWNIVVVNKSSGATSFTQYSNGITVGNTMRTRAEGTDRRSYCIRNSHIIGTTDELLDLDENTLKSALDKTKELRRMQGIDWDKPYPSPTLVRQQIRGVNEPLLLIYTLDPFYAFDLGTDGKIDKNNSKYGHNDEPFVGFAIAFPHTDTGYSVSYTANMVEDFAQTNDDFDNDNDNIEEE